MSSRAAATLQRKCACGKHTSSGEQCADCQKRNTSELQRKPSHERSTSHFDLTLVPVRHQQALIVSDPADPMEVEADRAADRVLQSQAAMTASAAASPLVQRQTELSDQKVLDQEGADDADEVLSEDADMNEDLDADAGGEAMGDASGRPKLAPGASTQERPRRIAIPDAGGSPLEQPTRAFMQRHFGHDFSGVRIHADAQAADSAQALQANAYTVGEHVFFGPGRYNPASREGLHLLAHELTHVVQQGGGAQVGIQRAPSRRHPKGPMDAPRRERQGRKRSSKPKPKCATGECDGNCAAPAEKAQRNPGCGNETCSNGSAASSSNFIRHLDVDLTTQMVTAELGTAAKTVSTTSFISSPNAGTTPQGRHTIGRKCGPCHTNRDAHGMGWFTGFHNDLEYGFHNSQRVGTGIKSLGCVRVAPCDRAKWIHDNTTSGVTTVCVHNGDHCKPKPKPKSKGKKSANEPAPDTLPSEPMPATPVAPLPVPVAESEPAGVAEEGV